MSPPPSRDSLERAFARGTREVTDPTPKRGRPALPPGEARRRRIPVVVSAKEEAELRAKARRADLSLSEYIRRHGVR